MTTTARRTRTLKVERPEFRAWLRFDQRNERLTLLSYAYYGDIAPLVELLIDTARQERFGKLVVVARGSDWEAFLTRGFALEASSHRYFHGAPGHFMSYFLSAERQVRDRLEEEQALLQSVLEQERADPAQLPDGYRMAEASPAQAEELAALYDRVFPTYPSPLSDPAYVRELIESGDGLFLLAVTGDGQIASAAAAEIDRENANAEITNCATLPDHRGEGLMATLVDAVQGRLAEQQIECVYSMARAHSYGMNLVLHRLGYQYRGRLIRHAHIGGSFEDLNLWEKIR
ncbi:MAG: putative beta-lysine N-acetyltransferase [Bacillota bacterium]